MERVKEKFDLYHTLKTHMPEFTRNRDPSNEKILGLICKGLAIPLPNLESPDSPRLYLYRFGCIDPSETSLQDLIKMIGIVGELIFLDDDNFIVAGQVAIFDFDGFTLSHVSLFNPVLLRKLTMIHQEGSSLREQGSHFVNLPSVALTTFNLVLSSLKEKNRKRMHVHNDMESLYKVVPRRLLPKEYGGEAGTIQELTEDLEKRLLAKRDFFLEDEKFGVDEKKRVTKTKYDEYIFGLEGSFRQLNFD